MPEVIVKESSYDYGELRASLFEMLAELDGGAVKRGSKVLIKPNLLLGAKEDRAITTHPLIIKAAAEYAISKGALVRVSDSPALGSFNKISIACGLRGALRGLDVVVKEFGASRTVPTGGRFKNIEVSSAALDADVIINLPKLKTHAQMGMTLAVKNLFGCVVGMRKPEWHYRVGDDKHMFAELLVTIWSVLRPPINIIDGILSMEGDGPGTGGTPRRTGVLLGSSDAPSLDMAVCRMVGIDPFSIPTNKAAKEMGFLSEYSVAGNLPVIQDFQIPATADLLFGPKLAHRFVRRHVTVRPVNIKELCKLCGECVKMCPADALETHTGIKAHERGLRFDYEKCIRCYCCIEVCPHGAMSKETPLLRKALRPFMG